MKNLNKREGFKNRHIDGLPTEVVKLEIIYKDVDGEHIRECVWHPYNKEDWVPDFQPSEGFLGCALDIEYSIGYNVWEQDNKEFIYYREL